MTDSSRYREAITAFIDGDGQRAKDLTQQVVEAESRQYSIFVSGVFLGFVEDYFEEDSSPEAIKAFMDELLYAFRNTDPQVKPLVVEGLIRGALGETHLLKDISAKDRYLGQLPVLRMIAHKSESIRSNLSQYFEEADDLLSESQGS